MNIFNAPLKVFFRPPRSGIAAGPKGQPPADSPIVKLGRPLFWFLGVSTILAIWLVGAGTCVLILRIPGDIEITGQGLAIKTQTGGLALIGLGLVFYLAVGALLMNRLKD